MKRGRGRPKGAKNKHSLSASERLEQVHNTADKVLQRKRRERMRQAKVAEATAYLASHKPDPEGPGLMQRLLQHTIDQAGKNWK
jgi:hypothetical protein